MDAPAEAPSAETPVVVPVEALKTWKASQKLSLQPQRKKIEGWEVLGASDPLREGILDAFLWEPQQSSETSSF